MGLARVYSFPDNRACVRELLATENDARGKRLGVWASPAYRIESADDVDGFGRLTHSCQLVEGRLLGAGEGAGRVYHNFARNWQSDFTIAVARKDASAFAARASIPKGSPAKGCACAAGSSGETAP